jgi:DNA-binding CsgD family transcriptional regulator
VRREVEKEVMNELKNALTNKKLAEILKGNIQDE